MGRWLAHGSCLAAGKQLPLVGSLQGLQRGLSMCSSAAAKGVLLPQSCLLAGSTRPEQGPSGPRSGQKPPFCSFLSGASIVLRTPTCRVHASADLSQGRQRLLHVLAMGPHRSLTRQRRQGCADVWQCLLTRDAQSRRNVDASACRQQTCRLDGSPSRAGCSGVGEHVGKQQRTCQFHCSRVAKDPHKLGVSHA